MSMALDSLRAPPTSYALSETRAVPNLDLAKKGSRALYPTHGLVAVILGIAFAAVQSGSWERASSPASSLSTVAGIAVAAVHGEYHLHSFTRPVPCTASPSSADAPPLYPSVTPLAADSAVFGAARELWRKRPVLAPCPAACPIPLTPTLVSLSPVLPSPIHAVWSTSPHPRPPSPYLRATLPRAAWPSHASTTTSIRQPTPSLGS
ncbi:hypothetical protein C8J57DRAFT_1619688 [Mycena rebaudengoi]|nr:hypothetical protein C8J57DRAFT_1619688 [Mycena rebaudengoi]